jgi:hypothetical protein
MVETKLPGWVKLPDEEQRLLNETCGPGMRLMRQLSGVC